MTPEEFLAKLSGTADSSGVTDFCRKFMLHGTPFVFKDRENDFYDFRKRIADKYTVYFNEIYITGSAKLGFSPFKKTTFSYDSDIDVAIVSAKLFSHIMEIVREYQMSLREARRTVTEKELIMYHEFLEYAAIGWIRPDKLPLSFQVSELKNDWFDFFKSISYGASEVGNYKVTAGVFQTYRHLELYNVSGLNKLKKKLEIVKKP